MGGGKNGQGPQMENWQEEAFQNIQKTPSSLSQALISSFFTLLTDITGLRDPAANSMCFQELANADESELISIKKIAASI